MARRHLPPKHASAASRRRHLARHDRRQAAAKRATADGRGYWEAGESQAAEVRRLLVNGGLQVCGIRQRRTASGRTRVDDPRSASLHH